MFPGDFASQDRSGATISPGSILVPSAFLLRLVRKSRLLTIMGKLVSLCHFVGKMSMKTRKFFVVFPLFLSLVAPSVSFRADFPRHDAETMDACIPIISKDYFPAFTDSFLLSSKSRSKIPLWHKRLYLQSLHWTYRPETSFGSSGIVPPSAFSLVASETVMRC